MPEFIASVLVFTGIAFCLGGAIGMLRFPDLFARMHSSGVTDTLGSLFVLAGLMLLTEAVLVALKLVFILAFSWMASPTATHAVAKAALHGGEKPMTDDADSGERPLLLS